MEWEPRHTGYKRRFNQKISSHCPELLLDLQRIHGPPPSAGDGLTLEHPEASGLPLTRAPDTLVCHTKE